MVRIRARRGRSGLAPQHIAAIRAVATACDATCEGLRLGGDRIVFRPQIPMARDIKADVGTAGSVALVLQAWLPVALVAGGSITITGGTEVDRSPTIDYLEQVLFRVLARHGAKIRTEILKRGYYPEGGGEVRVSVEESRLSPISFQDEKPESCGIISCSSNLPDHVAERQAAAAERLLAGRLGIPCEVRLDRRKGVSTGSSCTVWAGPKGATCLGKRGLPADRVGEMAARALLEEIAKGGPGGQPPRRPASHLPRPVRRTVHRTGLLPPCCHHVLAPQEVRVPGPLPDERRGGVLRMRYAVDASFFFSEAALRGRFHPAIGGG